MWGGPIESMYRNIGVTSRACGVALLNQCTGTFTHVFQCENCQKGQACGWN